MKTNTQPTRYIEINADSIETARADFGAPLPFNFLPQVVGYAGPPLSGTITFDGGSTARECDVPPVFAEVADEVDPAYEDPRFSDDECVLLPRGEPIASPAPRVPFASRLVHAAIAAKLPKRGPVDPCVDADRRARYVAHFTLACASHPPAPAAELATSQRHIIANAADFGVALGLPDGELVRGVATIPGLKATRDEIFLHVRDARDSGLWPNGPVSGELDAAHAAILAERVAAAARAAELARIAKTQIKFRPIDRNRMAIRIEAGVKPADFPHWLGEDERVRARCLDFVSRSLWERPVFTTPEGARIIFAPLPALVAKRLEWDEVPICWGVTVLPSDLELEALPADIAAEPFGVSIEMLQRVLETVTAGIDSDPMDEAELRDLSTFAGRGAAKRFREVLESVSSYDVAASWHRTDAQIVRRLLVEVGIRTERLAPEVVHDLINARMYDIANPPLSKEQLAQRADILRRIPDTTFAAGTPCWLPAEVGAMINTAMAGAVYLSPGEDEEGIVSSIVGAAKGVFARIMPNDPSVTIVEKALEAAGTAGRFVRTDELVRVLQDAGLFPAKPSPRDMGWLKGTCNRAGWSKANRVVDGQQIKVLVQRAALAA